MAWVGFVIGVLVVAFATVSLVTTFVLPRGGSRFQGLAMLVSRIVRRGFLLAARPVASFARKDGLLAAVGPVALIAQLAAFLGLYILGYGLVQWPWTKSFPAGLREAAASLFSVGLVHASTTGNDAVVVLAGATGAIAVALQIGYLPAIYQAFNRREALVTLMESRAGVPAWGPEVLMRHQLVGITDALPRLYGDWELWAADLAESHISYPVLLWFRSPEPGFSWIISLLAVLDAAAMHLSLNPTNAPSEARMCLRMGFTALRRIAQTLHWDFDKDPSPTGDIQLTYEEFAYAVNLVKETGFPTERATEEAWRHFRGWRVNYESLAYRLADHVVAPRAPWSGERRHLPLELMPPKRPPHRNPDGKVFYDQKYRPD
ncbi:MAG: hypothetical protein ABSB52_06530 [Acidimicrobiales bacterium]|jgi:hypothetical protein